MIPLPTRVELIVELVKCRSVEYFKTRPDHPLSVEELSNCVIDSMMG